MKKFFTQNENYIQNREKLCRQEQQVYVLRGRPAFCQAASVVGPKEAEGPFGALFDEIDPDGKCGQDNWEQAESELQKRAVKKVIEKAHLLPKQIRYVFAG